jgi:D-alanine-D-alanine ligase
VIADQFYAERLYSRDRIFQLLEQVGFEKIRFHGSVETQSDRQQDLGMMAHRMIITAAAPIRVAPGTARRAAVQDITVLLGDPSLPDMVKLDGRFNPEDLATIDKLKDALAERSEYRFAYLDNHAALMAELRNNPPTFVLNFCDEGFNNDAFLELHVPAFLEMLGIPYSGGGPACLGLCYNKNIVNSIAASMEIPIPLETYYDPADTSATLPSIFPALVKPNFGDSSIGITAQAVVYSPEQLVEYMDQIHQQWPGRPILIQEFLEGTEYSVGVIGNPGLSYRILPPLQVDYSGLDPGLPKILGYESKWDPTSPYWTQITYQEATIDDVTRANLYDWSNAMFERCQCRDYARFDFRADVNGNIKLLEVNPNPGWCWDGKFNFMAGFGGLRYSDMLYMVLEAALERFSTDKDMSKQKS